MNLFKDWVGEGEGEGVTGLIPMAGRSKRGVSTDPFPDSLYYITIYTGLIPGRCRTTHWYVVLLLPTTPSVGQVQLSCFK